MSNLDDERFEAYLKRFQPLSPRTLRFDEQESRSPGSFARTAWVLAACAVLFAALLTLDFLAVQIRSPEMKAGVANDRLTGIQTLTVRSANALLFNSSSFKAAVDETAFQRQSVPLPRDSHSALVVLSKENTKL